MTNSKSFVIPSFKKLSEEEFESAVDEEIYRRALLYRKCRELDWFAEAQLKLCEMDPLYFINNYVWTFDPRTHRKKYPFKLFPFQETYIRWRHERLVNREWGHVDKSRDMGVTWQNVAHNIHQWLFVPKFTSLFGSITEKKVDDRTLDSTFGKARFVIENLPPFMRPPLKPDRHDKHMLLENPTNDAYIRGESMSINFGRSGRSSIVDLDEFAHVAHSAAILASLSQTAKCAIFTSTPKGYGNEFGRMKKEAKIPHISLHWTEHPLKTKDWYDGEADKLEEHMVAQELDISYELSLGTRYYKRFRRDLHVAKEVIFHNPNHRQYVFWDFGHGGAMAVIFFQVTPEGEIQIWCNFEIKDQDIDFCIPITKGHRPHQYDLLRKADKNHIDWVLTKVPEEHFGLHGGDNAGKQQTANSKRSCKMAIEEAFNKIDDDFRFISTGKQTYDWRKRCVDHILKPRQNSQGEWYSRLQVSPDCERFIECMNNAQFNGENPHTDKPAPKLDGFYHMVSAFEFAIINLFPISESTGYREEKIR